MAQQPQQMGTKFYSLLMFLGLSVISGVLIAGLFVPAAALVGGTAKATASAMENLPVELQTPPQAEKTTLFMSDGSKLAELYADDRTYVTMDKISPWMKIAQLNIEDKRFYEHGALDFRGTMRAIFVSGGQQGGSTISQQYVKQVQIENARAKADNAAVEKATERTISRKVQELRYAVAMERKLSKDEILERYLNIAYYADGSYGVESAARHYFNKAAKDLTIGESAMLAGLVKNPSALNPVVHTQAALERRNTVLAVMLSNKAITQEQYQAALKEKFDPTKASQRRQGCANSTFPFLCDYAVKELQKYPGLGKDPKERKENLERGGFQITLTVNPEQQAQAEENIHQRINPKDPLIGLLDFVDPQTGKIRIMAQSRNKMGNNPGETFINYNAAPGMGGAEGYQPGSTFKAFTLAAALAQGVPTSQRYNSPTPMNFTGWTFKSCSGPFVQRSKWTPKNDGGVSGNLDMIRATQQSVNTWFIQLEAQVGICEAIKMAEAAGVKITTKGKKLTDFDTIPAFTLGVAEVEPLSIAQSYATFANRGKRCAATIIESIKTKTGKTIPYPPPVCTQTIDPNVADGLASVLKNVTRGDGSGSPMAIRGYDIAGKTGTTDGAAAMWWTGFVPNMAGTSAIVIDKQHPFWKGRPQRGFDVPPSALEAGIKINGYGLDAGKFWTPTMRMLLRDLPKVSFTDPSNDISTGKMVDIPQLTGDPDQDQQLLVAAGFQVERVQTPSSRPRGAYIGASRPSGQAPMGSTIKLLFSSGTRRTTSAPTQNAPAPTAPATTAPAPAPVPTVPAPVPTVPAPVPTVPGWKQPGIPTPPSKKVP